MTGLILVAVLAQAPADSTQELHELPEPDAEVAQEDLAEHLPKEGPGGRFGVVSLAAATVSFGMVNVQDPLGGGARLAPRPVGISALAALGFRYGFLPRAETGTMAMPGMSFVLGTLFQTNNLSPFLEARGELMVVTPGGPLQPNFVVYTSTGAGLTPLGPGRRSISVQPHVGFGFGWNWRPKGGGGGGGDWSANLGSLGSGGGGAALIAIPIALAIVGFVFAGRVEFRYTARPITGPGNDFASVMIGFGS